MLNYEVTKSLANERRHELTQHAVVARLARRVRRNRRQTGRDDDSSHSYIVLPSSTAAGSGHAIAA
ncbi:MAG TPA: hypothetical protein VK611_30050 [Acidimicrobiales bacterium]|nr:hypothetical protein [Acidimicrobiales bacterium]